MRLKMHWGISIALVYTTFASGTLMFAWFAMRQPVDLVSADYYQRALDHDRHQAARARGLALGDTLRIDGEARPGLVTVTWRDAGSRPERGEATFYRPSSPASDQHVAVVPDRDGRQTFDLRASALAPGHWILQLSWVAPAGEFYAERPIVVR